MHLEAGDRSRSRTDVDSLLLSPLHVTRLSLWTALTNCGRALAFETYLVKSFFREIIFNPS